MNFASDETVFRPPLRLGLVFQATIIVLLSLLGGYCFWRAAQATIGPIFLLFLFPAMLTVGLIPWLAYRAYASYGAYYLLTRDGIRLHWGLRVETIPMNAITWVQRADDLDFPVPLPWLRWPGSVMGSRRFPTGDSIEFLATTTKELIVVATAERTFAISPEDPEWFLSVFRRCAELGSLTPLPQSSSYPSFLLIRIWKDRPARYLLLSGLALGLILLVWVSLLVPTRDTVPFGFQADGTPGDPVPAVQLLLLPVMNAFFYLANLLLGMFCYRREDRGEADQPSFAGAWKALAYLLWGVGVLTVAFFLSAVGFLSQVR